MRVCCAVLPDGTEKFSLCDPCAKCNPFGDTVKMEIDQKHPAVRWVIHLQDDVARTEAARSGVAGAGTVHLPRSHGVNLCPDGGRKVNPVVEVPPISVYARPER